MSHESQAASPSNSRIFNSLFTSRESTLPHPPRPLESHGGNHGAGESESHGENHEEDESEDDEESHGEVYGDGDSPIHLDGDGPRHEESDGESHEGIDGEIDLGSHGEIDEESHRESDREGDGARSDRGRATGDWDEGRGTARGVRGSELRVLGVCSSSASGAGGVSGAGGCGRGSRRRRPSACRRSQGRVRLQGWSGPGRAWRRVRLRTDRDGP